MISQDINELALSMHISFTSLVIRESPYPKDTSPQHWFSPRFKGRHLFNLSNKLNVKSTGPLACLSLFSDMFWARVRTLIWKPKNAQCQSPEETKCYFDFEQQVSVLDVF